MRHQEIDKMLTFKKLGYSSDEIAAEESRGNKFGQKAARTWLAMYNTPPPVESDFRNLETQFGSLPKDYRDFLQTHNGGIPSQTNLRTKSNIRVVDNFLALTAPRGFYDSIANYISIYSRRIPSGTVPIASAGGGDLLLLDVNAASYGRILYWDHNLEADDPDLATGHHENTEEVASSFTELLAKFTSHAGDGSGT